HPHSPTSHTLSLHDALPICPSLILTKSTLEIRLARESYRQSSPLPLGEGPGERACGAVSPHPNPPPGGEGNQIRVVLLDQDWPRSEEHTSELQSRGHLVCRL